MLLVSVSIFRPAYVGTSQGTALRHGHCLLENMAVMPLVVSSGSLSVLYATTHSSYLIVSRIIPTFELAAAQRATYYSKAGGRERLLIAKTPKDWTLNLPLLSLPLLLYRHAFTAFHKKSST